MLGVQELQTIPEDVFISSLLSATPATLVTTSVNFANSYQLAKIEIISDSTKIFIKNF